MSINWNLTNELLHLELLSTKRKKIEEVFDFLGEVKPNITTIRRLGKRTTAINRTRTMLIALSNPWAVGKVVPKAPMLTTHQSDKTIEVYVYKRGRG